MPIEHLLNDGEFVTRYRCQIHTAQDSILFAFRNFWYSLKILKPNAVPVAIANRELLREHC